MYFASLAELWAMSGHGPYVWSAYVITLLVLLALTVYPLRRKQQALHAIRQRALHEQQHPKESRHADAPQA